MVERLRLLYEDADVGAQAADKYEWFIFLTQEEQREFIALEQARRKQEQQIIQDSQRKLAGRNYAAVPTTPPRRQAETHGYSALKVIDADKLARLLREDNGREKEEFFTEVWYWARRAWGSPFYQLLAAAVSVVSCSVYIAQTFMSYPYGPSYDGLEGFFLAAFFFDAVFSASASYDAITYVLSWAALVDALSMLPSLLFLIGGSIGSDTGFLRFLRLIKSWRALRRLFFAHEGARLKAGDAAAANLSERARRALFWRKLISLVLYLVTLVLMAAGCVVLLDEIQGGGAFNGPGTNRDGGLTFGAGLYLMMSTFTTVGYGDIIPASGAARGVTMALVTVFFVLLPYLAVEAMPTLSNPPRLGRRHRQRDVRERHVVICGGVSFESLRTSLREIYHPDHTGRNAHWLRAVVLSPEPPDPAVSALLDLAEFRERVTYLRGTPLNPSDLGRARAEDAAGVLLLVDKQGADTKAEDMRIILSALSIVSHVRAHAAAGHAGQEAWQRGAAGGPALLVEVNNPNSAVHVRAAGVRHVVASEEVKLLLLGQNCVCPGWSTLVCNLWRSHGRLPAEAVEQGAWVAEYYIGASKRPFSVEFSPLFVGGSFIQVAIRIFELFELTIIAVESQATGLVHINPGENYFIEEGDRAFVLAESLTTALRVWEYFRGYGSDENETNEEAVVIDILGAKKLARLSPDAFVLSMATGRTLAQCRKPREAGEPPSKALLAAWADVFESTCHWDVNALHAELQHPRCRADTAVSATTITSVIGGGGLRAPNGGMPAGGRAGMQAGGSAANGLSLGGNGRSRTPMMTQEESSVSLGDQSGVPRRWWQLAPPAREPGLSPPPQQPAAAAGEESEAGVARLRETGGCEEELAALQLEHWTGDMALAYMRGLQGRILGSTSMGGAPTAAAAGVGPSKAPGYEVPLTTARHLRGHVVVTGFSPQASHLAAFLRPLRCARRRASARLTVVFMAPSVMPVTAALARLHVDEPALNLSGVFVLRGQPVSRRDLDNAGVTTAACVLSLASGRPAAKAAGGDITMADSEVLVAFAKLQELPAAPRAAASSGRCGGGGGPSERQIVVELRHEGSVPLLHAFHDSSVLSALSSLGPGHTYLWPKVAAGSCYTASSLDALLAQAFHRPSRIALLERVLRLNSGRGGGAAVAAAGGTSNDHQAIPDFSSFGPRQGEDDDSSSSDGDAAEERKAAAAEERKAAAAAAVEAEVGVYQIAVPRELFAHSFGELFQQLAAPPFQAIAIGLYRARGTQAAPEPYVYTAPQADTVLRAGDRAYVLGRALRQQISPDEAAV